MATPTTRDEFKAYCLRALGDGVIQINISDEQVEDRIDEALKYYWDYHFDGSEKIYYKHQITANTITDKYITLPENIIGAVRIFPLGTTYGMGDMFNIRYQIALNDLYTLTSTSLIPYYMVRSHLSLLEEMLVGQQPIRYNRHRNQLFIDMDWNNVNVGQYIIVEAYQIVDPDIYTDAWGDRWLYRYTTELIKKQWGNNLKKYGNMQMPGGIVFNGQQIYDEADAEIKKLEREMIDSFSLPVSDMIF
jgi:hypothetical protein